MDKMFPKNKNFTHFNRKFLINNLVKEYDFLFSGRIGQSLCGRSIDFIRLGNPNKSNLWVCAHHGMEWLTSMVVLKFLKEVCDKIKNKRCFCGINLEKKFDEKGLVIIPCLNPDGVDISLQGPAAAGNFYRFVEMSSRGKSRFWQANARGVDLNHNYSAGWNELHSMEIKNGIIKPCSTRFGGARPLSEPETIYLTNFCKKNNFSSAIAFHSQGEEIYWDFGPKTPKNSREIAEVLAVASGYTVSKPEGLAVGGGFKDWFIETFSKPAFTIELGKGQNPLPASDLDSVYKKAEKMLYIASFI